MHPKNVKEGKFDIGSDASMDSLVFKLDDNGDWEYERVGIGRDKEGVFLVDLNDTGFRYRDKQYVRPGLSVTRILEIGVKHNVFAKGGHHGYQYRVDEEKGNWEAFIAELV